MARAVLLRCDHGSSKLRDKMDLGLQSRTPKHGHGQEHQETAAGHSRMMSTAQSHQKWWDHFYIAKVKQLNVRKSYENIVYWR